MHRRGLLLAAALLVVLGFLTGCGERATDQNGELSPGGDILEGDLPLQVDLGREVVARGLVIVGSGAYAVVRRADRGFDVIGVSLQDGSVRVVAESADQEVAFSPDGRYMAYATLAAWHEDCQVKVVDLQAGDTRKLADTVGSIRGVDFSPDGHSLVFASEEGLILVGMDGEFRQTLVEGRVGGESTLLQFIPRWSPDGTCIAYAVTYYEGSGPISLVEARNGAVTKVSDGDDWDAYWSPDGTRILHTKEEYDSDHSEVWLVDLADGEHSSRVLIDSKGIYRGLGWSPDGRRILVQYSPPQREPGEFYTRLMTYDMDTGDLHEIPTDGAVSSLVATWAADGYVYYATDEGLLLRVLPDDQ